jgi:hypothetical protein
MKLVYLLYLDKKDNFKSEKSDITEKSLIYCFRVLSALAFISGNQIKRQCDHHAE